jgi:hypothetical protein
MRYLFARFAALRVGHSDFGTLRVRNFAEQAKAQRRKAGR